MRGYIVYIYVTDAAKLAIFFEAAAHAMEYRARGIFPIRPSPPEAALPKRLKKENR